MPTFNKSFLTNAGYDLVQKVNGGFDKLAFTKVVFSSSSNANLTDDGLKQLTNIDNPTITISNINVYKNNESGQTNIRAYVSNENLKTGVYVSTYGVFAKDSSGKEILFSIEVADHASFLIANSDKQHPSGLMYTFKVNIGQTDNVQFTSDKDTYATVDDLEQWKKSVQTNTDNSLKESTESTDKKLSFKSNIDDVKSDFKVRDNEISDLKDKDKQLTATDEQLQKNKISVDSYQNDKDQFNSSIENIKAAINNKTNDLDNRKADKYTVTSNQTATDKKINDIKNATQTAQNTADNAQSIANDLKANKVSTVIYSQKVNDLDSSIKSNAKNISSNASDIATLNTSKAGASDVANSFESVNSKIKTAQSRADDAWNRTDELFKKGVTKDDAYGYMKDLENKIDGKVDKQDTGWRPMNILKKPNPVQSDSQLEYRVLNGICSIRGFITTNNDITTGAENEWLSDTRLEYIWTQQHFYFTPVYGDGCLKLSIDGDHLCFRNWTYNKFNHYEVSMTFL